MNYFVTFIRLLWNRYLNFEILIAILTLVAVYQFVIRSDAVYEFIGRIIAKLELRVTGHYDESVKTNGVNLGGQKGKVIWEVQKENVGIFAVQGRRPHMEDRFNEVTVNEINTSLYGVFDGHGGEFAAEFTEKTLFKNLLTRIHKSGLTPIRNPAEVLKSEILDVDQQLLNIEISSGDISGSTLVVAMVRDDELVVANIGDSRGVLCDGEGKAVPLTEDHKPNLEKERKRIEQAGGFVSFNGVWRAGGILATSRALGDLPLKKNGHVSSDPDIMTFDLKALKPKFMILATDGLWDVFSNQDAVNFVSERLHESYFGAKSLVLQAFYRGSPDNITIMVVKFPQFEKKKRDNDEDFEEDLEFFDTSEEILADDDDKSAESPDAIEPEVGDVPSVEL